MAKANGEEIISLCLIELSKGSNHTETFAVICRELPCARRTFDKYWKIAQERYLETQRKAQMAMADQYIQSALEGQEAGIMSKQDRMRIASEIAQDKGEDTHARLKAMDYLSKIEGDYAPSKTEHSGTIGGGFTDDQFETALNAAREEAKTRRSQ